MTENDYNSKIENLKSEIVWKDKEIRENLDKIESLEDFIMEIEADLKKKSGKTETSLLRVQLKGLERKNKEMKKSLGLLRLDNIKLKQELESYKKGYFENISLIQIQENDSFSYKLENNLNLEKEISNNNISQEELFNNINVKCPICEIRKVIRIPTKLINPFQSIKTINVPKGVLCEHSIQFQIDRSLSVERYEVVNLESSNMEVFNCQESGVTKVRNEGDSKSLIQGVNLNGIRKIVDGREILGIFVFDREWNLIFASFPAELNVNVIKEFYIRKERKANEMTKMYIEFKDHQKCFSKNVDILGGKFILVLLFSEDINFGMGTMLFKEIQEKLVKLN